MVYNQVNSGVHRTRNRLSELQNYAATQKKLIKPSDDPAAMAQVLKNRVGISDASQYMKGIEVASSFLNYTDQALNELGDVLVRAKELAIAQSTDAGANALTRKTVAQEVKQIFWQVNQIGNRKLGDRFIFSGQKTKTPAFDKSGFFKGDHGEIRIQVDQQSYVTVNAIGSQVFKGQGSLSRGVARAGGQEALNALEFLHDLKEGGVLPAVEGHVSRQLGAFEGVDIFQVLKSFHRALISNDKGGVQKALPLLDGAINQVISARSSIGSRVTAIERVKEGLESEKINGLAQNSELEDADLVELVSSLNQVENTLKANLQTSGRLIQPSLLDFMS